MRAGGLRVHVRSPLPLEALRCGGDWAASFPIVRMQAIDAGVANFAGTIQSTSYGGEGEIAGSPELRKLVWFNPAGEPTLPCARTEAEKIFEILERAPGPTRFLARALNDHEWYELYDSHDVIFYYGHGLTVGGHPAILSRNGRAPFFAPVAANPERAAGRLLVFAACLSGGQTSFRNHTGAVVYPTCRLADRPSDFLIEFCEAWRSGLRIPAAFAAAARRDEAAGDMRRFVFRLQGAGTR